MEETWTARELPVLSAAIALLERSYMVTVSDIAEHTGLEQADVARALDALHPTHVDFRKTETGGDTRFWYILKVTPEARRAVGQWPTAEGLIDRLVTAFRDAAVRESDSERQYQLSQVAILLNEDTVRDAAVQAAASIVSPAEPPAVRGSLPTATLLGRARRRGRGSCRPHTAPSAAPAVPVPAGPARCTATPAAASSPATYRHPGAPRQRRA